MIAIFLEKRGARPFTESDGEEVGQKSEKRWRLENVSRGTSRKLAALRSGWDATRLAGLTRQAVSKLSTRQKVETWAARQER